MGRTGTPVLLHLQGTIRLLWFKRTLPRIEVLSSPGATAIFAGGAGEEASVFLLFVSPNM